ncbi:MAG: pyridoxal phosphate-dependent aminotransferase [Deltaproteobacteria bacterium]|nr:pyridoxal phosphate-dependent aminotransferase [Deltaproteobacteria bacterium]
MPPKLSSRTKDLSPFMVMEVLERALYLEGEGKSIIHMEVGEPDFKTPDIIVSAMKEALDSGAFKYTHSLGDPSLREALSRHYKERYGLDIDPGRFFVTPGTSVGLTLLMGALLNPGDKVIISNPHYACYPNFLRFFSGVPLYQDVLEKDGFRYDPSLLKNLIKDNSPVKAIMINSPANPTGAVMEPWRLKEIASLGVFIIADEIYHGLNYSKERDHSVLEYTDDAVVVGGFSKAYAMTGWRVGYLVVPHALSRTIQIISQNFLISTNAACQKAALVALDKAWPEVLKMREIFNERRLRLLSGLKSLGLTVMVEPTGAFYVLAKASHISPDSRSLSFRILEDCGVALTPGVDFGSGAEGFLRFSYATSLENIEEGIKRLSCFFQTLKD